MWCKYFERMRGTTTHIYIWSDSLQTALENNIYRQDLGDCLFLVTETVQSEGHSCRMVFHLLCGVQTVGLTEFRQLLTAHLFLCYISDFLYHVQMFLLLAYLVKMAVSHLCWSSTIMHIVCCLCLPEVHMHSHHHATVSSYVISLQNCSDEIHGKLQSWYVKVTFLLSLIPCDYCSPLSDCVYDGT